MPIPFGLLYAGLLYAGLLVLARFVRTVLYVLARFVRTIPSCQHTH